MDARELLTHAEFVRALARRLVLDDQRAADVAQETWLAALRHPPAAGQPLRAWLARVTRNFALRQRRDEGRRRVREEREDGRGVPSPDRILAREETRRHVIEAVLGLEEPYRAAILLRYYENLSPRRVAERLGVPTATVKTRLRRGLEQLRARLDARYGADRRDWCVALLPLAGLESVSLGAPTLLTPGFLGAWIMIVKLKIAAVLVVLLVAAYVGWRVVGVEPSVEPMEATTAELVGAKASETAGGTSELTSPEPAAVDTARSAVGPGPLILSVVVTDAVTEAPVPAYDVRVTRRIPDSSRLVPVAHETVRDDTGRFSVTLPQAGRYRVDVRSARYRLAFTPDFEVIEAEPPDEVRLALDPGLAVWGRVVEHATGEPLAGVLVTSDACARGGLGQVLRGFPEHEVHARTDEDGWFQLRGLREVKAFMQETQRIAALHPDFAEAFVELIPHLTVAELEEMVARGAADDESIELRLRPGFHVFGTAHDDGGEPLEGLVVSASSLHTPVGRAAITDADGRYRTAPVAPGMVQVHARAADWVSAEESGFTPETRGADVIDADVEVNFGPRADHVTWRGTAYGADGVALGGVRLSLSVVSNPTFPPVDGNHSTTADAEGRFEFRKLLATTYNVSRLSGPLSERLTGGQHMTFETPGLVTRDFHVAGAVIGGVLVNEWTGEAITQAAGARVSALGGTKTRVATFSSVDEAGRFSMQGLPAGDYRLTVTADGYPVKWVRVSVEENEVRDDLRVEMPPGGQVVFEFRGFEGLGLDEFQLELRSKPPGTGFNRGGSLEEDGNGESEFVVCAGDYEAALLFESWGSMKARFSVAVDETTRVILTPDDRVGGEVRTVTVEGWITRADHSPLGGTRFMVFPRDVPGLEIGSHDRTPQADTEGHFALEGMRPGTWIVVGILADGTEHTFPDIVIPSDAPDPFEVSLIFHAGKVIGRFVDALTGEAFPPSEPLWRAELHDVNTGDLVSEVRKGERGPRMELASIPAGEHRLSIVARGFQDLELASVHVAEGEVVDVGELSLEPSGTLDLELTDADGEPVVNVDISCNGVKLRPFQLEGLTPTSCRCYNLPFGTVTISVKAEGFAAEECDVLLEPGITGQASLVVHPK